MLGHVPACLPLLLHERGQLLYVPDVLVHPRLELLEHFSLVFPKFALERLGSCPSQVELLYQRLKGLIRLIRKVAADSKAQLAILFRQLDCEKRQPCLMRIEMHHWRVGRSGEIAFELHRQPIRLVAGL